MHDGWNLRETVNKVNLAEELFKGKELFNGKRKTERETGNSKQRYLCFL